MWKNLFLALAALLALQACSESTDTTAKSNVAVSFSTARPSGSLQRVGIRTAESRLLDDTLISGTDTLILTRVRIVLREIELKRIDVTDCDDLVDDDSCEEFAFGPELIDLPLNSGFQQVFALDIDEGTFSEIEFDIHKPDDDDPSDLAFIAANPLFADQSIRVEGTFNGSAFIFESDLNVEQELELQPALVVSGSGSTNVTILVDLDAWFRDTSGSVVDPATANKGEPNEGLVKDNIKQSFEAFEDEDRDSKED